ncbi:MAG TPA: 2,3-bisphosphoglycerate-independent phosphoglycerate mutase [Longimicrobiales bacterium]|nr:2,3-bisphosphoglycerate-independent phosphoglycerate mutase [Longimicrobiales bacterium]
MAVQLPDDVVERGNGKIVFLILDGLGGLPHPDTGKTELETANTPNLDRLARTSAVGLAEPVLPGIAPGSGPGHLALFGYDPIRWNIGRGVLSALGVDFELREGDVAARLNFTTVDASGNIVDRRAGRPSDAENRRLVEKLRAGVRAPDGVEVFFEPEKEHRLVLVFRGSGLSEAVSDSDPQETGVPPLRLQALAPGAERTVQVAQDVLDQCQSVLRGEDRANGVVARGFAQYRRYPTIEDRYSMRALAIARYPMYRGVARLLGMELQPVPASDEGSIDALEARFEEFDFFFIHVKTPDARGEDGDFEGKARAIEAVDALIPRIEALKPAVLLVTGDHSTPATFRAHSWHPVPLLLSSKWVRTAPVSGFGERECLKGELGIVSSKHLMSLALAHAGRLSKYGA